MECEVGPTLDFQAAGCQVEVQWSGECTSREGGVHMCDGVVVIMQAYI